MTAPPGRPSLLFLTPILPAETGNGLAMRAGVFLDALARDYDITLLIIPLAGQASRITPFVTQRTRRVVTLDIQANLDPLWALCERLIDPEKRADALAAYPRPALCRYATTPSLLAAQQALEGQSFQRLHVMRSYLAAYARPFLRTGMETRLPLASIDLDDDECVSQRRIAELCGANNQTGDARFAAAEAIKYARHEAEWLPRFQTIITCATPHAEKIAAQYPACRSAVVPNTVNAPSTTTARLLPFGKHILFVGNLSYLPNVDGIRYFVAEILPRLRACLGKGVTLRIAGSAPTEEIAGLVTLSGIELIANPADMARHYRWADLAVIPLRAGGGTRIKLLEAFAHGVPVVSTHVGAEGIAVKDRQHLLLADSPEAFASACAAILDDVSLARRLKKCARRLVEEHYSHAVGVNCIRAALAPGSVESGNREPHPADAPNE